MGTTAQKLTYLNETKTLLKNKINLTGANITTDTFRQYPTKLQNALLECWNNEGEPIFTNWGTKVNGEGTNVELDNTINARMKITPKGNTSQTGTPTPSSPVPVNVVSGDNEVVVFNKNFIKSVGNLVSNIVYFNNVSSQTTYQFKAGTYTFSYKDNNEASLFIKDTTGTQTYLGTSKTITFTANNDFNIYLFRSGITIEELSEVQLEKGSTATTYEPYTSQNYPLYLGVENLLDLKNGTYGNNGVTAVVTNGQVLLNGTPTSGSSFITIQLNKKINWVNGKDHTIMINNNTSIGTENTYGAVRIDLNGTLDTKFNIANNYKVVNIDVSSVYNDKIQIRSGYGITYNNYVIEPKIIVASKPNYISDTPIELNKIGTYQDYIYKTDKWYLHKEVGKVVLNGSETWEKGSDDGNRYYFFTASLDSQITTTTGISDYFPIGYSSSGSCINLTLSYAHIKLFMLKTLNIDSVATLTQWLTTNNVSLYYALQTPTETEITNTTLINQLEALKGAMSYEGQTNISSGFMIVGASALGELE